MFKRVLPPRLFFMTGIKISKNQGFTLVETMVALFLFIILITITGNVFLTGLNNQRRAFAIQSMLENVNLITESLTKEIRVADIIHTPDTICPAGSSTQLAFHHPQNGEISYVLQNGDLIKTVEGASDRLNSGTVRFSGLGFCIVGTAYGDGLQPRVTIFGTVTSTQSNQEALQIPFQTTISPRLIKD